MLSESEKTLWYPNHLDQYLNRWFSNYEAARRSLETEGGFLFPFKHHFFVCEWGAVKAMGLDPDDPDWEAIGRDCAKPADQGAYGRIVGKRRKRARAEEKSRTKES